MKNFMLGFLQVFLVSAQTYFISRLFWPGIAAGGFLISFVWTLNVRSMSIGSWCDRVTYSAGAMTGALAGVFVSIKILGG